MPFRASILLYFDSDMYCTWCHFSIFTLVMLYMIKLCIFVTNYLDSHGCTWIYLFNKKMNILSTFWSTIFVSIFLQVSAWFLSSSYFQGPKWFCHQFSSYIIVTKIQLSLVSNIKLVIFLLLNQLKLIIFSFFDKLILYLEVDLFNILNEFDFSIHLLMFFLLPFLFLSINNVKG